MTLKICSKQFYSNYIFHPKAVELTLTEQRKALINSICLGIFTLGFFQLVCMIKYRNRKFKLPTMTEDPLTVLTKLAPRVGEAYLIDFTKINPGNIFKIFSTKGKNSEELSLGDGCIEVARGFVYDDFPFNYSLSVIYEANHKNGHLIGEASLLFRMNAEGKIRFEGKPYDNFNVLMEQELPNMWWWSSIPHLNFTAVGENKILRKIL